MPTRRNARFLRAIDAIDGAMRTAIRAHRDDPPGRPDLLSMLLQAFSDAGVSPEGTALRDEAVNLFIAGFEATATTLAWACHLLAESPDGWARLTQEVDAALLDRAPSAEDVPRLPLARAALTAARRLFPAGHVMRRSPCRPTRLGEHELPAETNVMINGFAIHRRPDYFPEPERFDPSRHAEGDETRGPRRFLPFGAGPWACLGNHLSLLLGALVLARVAQRFELRRTGRPAPPVETTFAIRPRGGLPLPVERRRAPRSG